MMEENNTKYEHDTKDSVTLQTPITPELALLNEELIKLKAEISFMSKALGIRTDDMSDRLSNSLNEFDNKLTLFNTAIDNQVNQQNKFLQELNTFVLLPEKLKNQIRDIVPDITNGCADIIKQDIESARGQINQLQEEITANFLVEREKINSATAHLTKEALNTSHTNRRKFLIHLATMTVFAIGISAITSYLITVQYPRFIEITGARDVIVRESDIKVLGTKLKGR